MRLPLVLLAGMWALTTLADSISMEEYDAARYQVSCDYDTRCEGPKKAQFCGAAPEMKKAFEIDKKRNRLMRTRPELERADWEACAAAAPTADCKAYPSAEDFILKHPRCSGVQDYLHHKGRYTIKR